MAEFDWNIRAAESAYTPALAGVYRDAILQLGPQAYSQGQLAVWAAFADGEDFDRLLKQGDLRVAERNGQAIGFAQLHPAHHIAMLFVAADHARRGVATALYRELESLARATGTPRLTAAASHLARPFFQRQGFRVVASEIVERQGERLERFWLHKDLPE